MEMASPVNLSLNYPSNPLSPKGSKVGTGGGSAGGSGSSGGSSGTTTAMTPSPAPVSRLVDWVSDVLGLSTEAQSSPSATAPAYQAPQPKNLWRAILPWWLVGSGLALLVLAWLWKRYGSE